MADARRQVLVSTGAERDLAGIWRRRLAKLGTGGDDEADVRRDFRTLLEE